MDRGATPFPEMNSGQALGGLKMKEIKEMKEEDLMKMLKAVRKEIDRRQALAREKYTGFKYPLKKTLKKEVDDGERSR